MAHDAPATSQPDIQQPATERATTNETDTAWKRVVCSRGTGYAVANMSRACIEKLIDFPEMPVRAHSRLVIKAGRSATVVRTELPFDEGKVTVAYKTVQRIGWVKKVTGLPRQNRTLRTWKLGHMFLKHGISTARPLLAIIPSRLALHRPSVIALTWIEGSQNVDAFVNKTAQLPAPRRRKLLTSAAISLGQQLGRMHYYNFSHRDLKPGNLIVVPGDTSARTYVIDLDGVNRHRSLPLKTKLRNLSRLAVGVQGLKAMSNTVCLRFLRSYLATDATIDRPWKEVWRELAQIIGERAAQRQKRKKVA